VQTINLGKGHWPTFERGAENEWITANGLGGYASSTAIGANTRKYHGLLVAALDPPVRRTLLLAKVDERFETGGRTYNLAANMKPGGVCDAGFIHLQRVLLDMFPTFIYSFADVVLEKTIFMVHGQNTTVLLYRVKNGSSPGILRLYPLVNGRDFHWNTGAGQVDFEVDRREIPGGAGITISYGSELPSLGLSCGGCASFTPREEWFTGMYYPREEERGENPVEDHFSPGFFEVPLGPGAEMEISFMVTIEDVSPGCCLRGAELLAGERARLNRLLEVSGLKDDFSRRLALSADSFIVRRRSTGAKSIIAGYHWFNDWGRDTMIALPGLTLVTGRHDDAREILWTFARYCREGLIPNMFPDTPGEPLYNTVDASLWFFNAAHKYIEYTGDTAFILKEIYPALKEIAGWYIKGTHYSIKMDEDGLIMAGTPQMQLTWMDASVDGWVVTPRQGKPVEISALWYNALVILEGLAAMAGEEFPHKGLPQKVKKSFADKFWYGEGGYLFDVIGGEEPDKSFRPNQVIALALPHSPVDPARARIVLRRVWQELYATYGLRSLSYYDPGYRGVYSGDRVSRDGAYHQGTVWSWLIGPFITAYRKAHGYSPSSREQARFFISPFRDHLASHGLGHISEIFDGNDPVLPRGCIAQAWGTGEILRAYVEDVLEAKGAFPDGRKGLRGTTCWSETLRECPLGPSDQSEIHLRLLRPIGNASSAPPTE